MPIREFFSKKGVVRGRSTAFVITVAVHVLLILGAGSYVALTVFQHEEPRFEGKQISRPKMKLKKLQVPIKVKKIRQPKFKQTMSAPAKNATMDFKMPAMGGIKGGTASFDGGGLGNLGFGMRFDTLFGGDASAGNELVGTFYDLKQTAKGTSVPMNDQAYSFRIKKFLESWKERDFEDFYQAPQKKYALSFMMPSMDAAAAPDAFGVGDVVQPKHWAIHYKGNITAPETGRYRFVGQADDFLFVRVNRKIVLDASLHGNRCDWESSAPESDNFPLGNSLMIYGDWIRLRKGQTVPIEILLGEMPGGVFSCYLFVEQAGKTYRQVSVTPGKNGGFEYKGGSRPVLPIFKMAEIPEGLVQKMKINPNEATVEGPVFGAGW